MPFLVSKTISLTFLERALASPHRIGFRYRPPGSEQWRAVTFGEFFTEVRALALGLRELGLRAGDKVALLSSTRYEWPLCDMAILGSRAITVPVYPSTTETDTAYLLSHSEASIVLVEDARQLDRLNALRAANPEPLARVRHIITFEQLPVLKRRGAELLKENPDWFENSLREALPGDIFTICYTSGTTGQPKGVQLTHDNIVSVLEDCRELVRPFASEEGETILSFLPFSHILGRVESLAVHAFAFEQFFARSLDSIPRDLLTARPTLLFAVPRLFEKAYARIQTTVRDGPAYRRLLFKAALATPGNILSDALVFRRVRARLGGRLKYAISGGAPLARELGEFFKALGVHILEGYGLTETGAPVAINTPAATRFGTVGRPLPEVRLRIAADGEIEVKSRKVFKGYYKMPAETAETLRDGWLATGDVGFLDREGYLHVTDRKKDLIVTSAGKNVAPQKIEALAVAFPLIEHLVVFGDRRNYLTALITVTAELDGPGAHARVQRDVQRAVDSINARLASFETVKKFVILPERFSEATGELTPSQKVRRAFVARKYSALIDAMYGAPPLSGESFRRAKP